MRSWLISTLARKAKQEGEESLRRLCPFDWLVWEPGQWRPSGSNVQTVMSPRTRIEEAPVPSAGESLVIALEPRPDKGEVTLGRAGCDIVIDERTLSSHHLSFTFDDHHWWVHDAGSRNGSMVEGRKLTREPVCLSAGASIRAAQVSLTYYTLDAMYARLKAGRV